MEGRGEKVGAKVKRKWKRREQSEGLWKVELRVEKYGRGKWTLVEAEGCG